MHTSTLPSTISGGLGSAPAARDTPPAPLFSTPHPAQLERQDEAMKAQARRALTDARRVGCVVVRPTALGAQVRVSARRNESWEWVYTVTQRR
ncbi:MAG: hypothetical protein AAFY88_08870 [Acidobacteriota bacterium]